MNWIISLSIHFSTGLFFRAGVSGMCRPSMDPGSVELQLVDVELLPIKVTSQ